MDCHTTIPFQPLGYFFGSSQLQLRNVLFGSSVEKIGSYDELIY
jgi:hypothetical protein